MLLLLWLVLLRTSGCGLLALFKLCQTTVNQLKLVFDFFDLGGYLRRVGE